MTDSDAVKAKYAEIAALRKAIAERDANTGISTTYTGSQTPHFPSRRGGLIRGRARSYGHRLPYSRPNHRNMAVVFDIRKPDIKAATNTNNSSNEQSVSSVETSSNPQQSANCLVSSIQNSNLEGNADSNEQIQNSLTANSSEINGLAVNGSELNSQTVDGSELNSQTVNASELNSQTINGSELNSLTAKSSEINNVNQISGQPSLSADLDGLTISGNSTEQTYVTQISQGSMKLVSSDAFQNEHERSLAIARLRYLQQLKANEMKKQLARKQRIAKNKAKTDERDRVEIEGIKYAVTREGDRLVPITLSNSQTQGVEWNNTTYSRKKNGILKRSSGRSKVYVYGETIKIEIIFHY